MERAPSRWLVRESGPWAASVALVLMVGCARLHRTTVGELAPAPAHAKTIDIKVDAVGVNIQRISHTMAVGATASKNESAVRSAKGAETATALIDLSPKTGAGTFSDDWSDALVESLRKECPDGVITNIQVGREHADYGFVSGEMVRVLALCVPGHTAVGASP